MANLTAYPENFTTTLVKAMVGTVVMIIYGVDRRNFTLANDEYTEAECFDCTAQDSTIALQEGEKCEGRLLLHFLVWHMVPVLIQMDSTPKHFKWK